MSLGDIIFVILVGFMIYECLLSPTSFLRSRRSIMRYMREKNAKKGITMRPGWIYVLPRGKRIVSYTGKEEDAKEI